MEIGFYAETTYFNVLNNQHSKESFFSTDHKKAVNGLHRFGAYVSVYPAIKDENFTSIDYENPIAVLKGLQEICDWIDGKLDSSYSLK